MRSHGFFSGKARDRRFDTSWPVWYASGMEKRECKHKFKINGWCLGKEPKIWECCSKCKESRERPATKAEAKRLWARHREWERRSDEWNRLWWKFAKRFGCSGDSANRFKYKGYDLMERVERFAKKNPTVRIAWVDDSYFSGSMIVFVPHECKEEYWGTTAVLIPQCSGEPPTEFFLYPGHVRELIQVLKGLDKQARAKPQRND